MSAVEAVAGEAFKQKVLADPAAPLKAEGIEIPPGIKVQAVENTAQQFTLVIPPKPDELSDEALDGVAGGFNEMVSPIPASGKLSGDFFWRPSS